LELAEKRAFALDQGAGFSRTVRGKNQSGFSRGNLFDKGIAK
jgi:hypothetical protein